MGLADGAFPWHSPPMAVRVRRTPEATRTDPHPDPQTYEDHDDDRDQIKTPTVATAKVGTVRGASRRRRR